MGQYLFHIHGMHCNSCALLIEDELRRLSGISKVKASLRHHQVQIEGEFGTQSEAEIIEQLAPCLQAHNFTISLERQARKALNWSELGLAFAIASLLIGGFVGLQKLGIVNLLTITEVNWLSAALLGGVASLSSCMAVVGGLTLSISASYAKAGNSQRPQIMFHVGRLVGFALLGGLLGAMGAGLRIQGQALVILNFLIAFIMLIMGLNLLDIVHWSKKIQPTLPRFVSHTLLQVRQLNHDVAPLLLGAVTFFLPCGFTQSMQFAALGSGSFTSGTTIMLAFALGTLPMLGLLSFAMFRLPERRKSLFFKTAGLVVIAFALLNLSNGLAATGLIPPLLRM